MPINLPAITNPYFLGMTACGHLQSDPDVLDRLFDESQHDFLATLTPDDEQMVLSLLVGDKSTKHVHIDFVKEIAYGKREGVPRVTADEIQNRLVPLMGESIAASFFARYRIPLDSLPEGALINILRFKVEFEPFSLATTGGELSITGAPIDSLNWKVRDDWIVVDLEGATSAKIGDNYLIDIYAILDRAFKGLVLPGGNDGSL